MIPNTRAGVLGSDTTRGCGRNRRCNNETLSNNRPVTRDAGTNAQVIDRTRVKTCVSNSLRARDTLEREAVIDRKNGRLKL
jgi:hypothetical protein